METINLIKLAHKGDKNARDTLIRDNMGLVWCVVKRFTNRGYDLQDLFQIGCIGLIKAVDKFDTEFEVQFSTYAVALIMGEIKRFLRDDGMIKVSRSLKENGYKIKKMAEKLSNEYGREAKMSEIADALLMPIEDVVASLEANRDVESIYKSYNTNDGDEVFLLDKIGDSKGKSGYGELLDKMLLKQLLDNLTSEQKKIIVLRYFRDMTQSEVAAVLGISQVKVSRMEKKILTKMRIDANS